MPPTQHTPAARHAAQTRAIQHNPEQPRFLFFLCFFCFCFFLFFLVFFCIFPRDTLLTAVIGETAPSIQSIELLTGRHLLAPPRFSRPGWMMGGGWVVGGVDGWMGG